MFYNYEYIYHRLQRSKFRNRFHLNKSDIEYINNKGMEIIYFHCMDFVNKKLKKRNIKNDGKQTPYKGHPVFIAQHATGTCCRKCINKWYKIPLDRDLTDDELNYIAGIIMFWINKEINLFRKNSK